MRLPAVRDDVRDSVLDAAERLFLRYGYRKTTVDELAREAGIGKGTIYLYFASKEAIVLAFIDRINGRLLEWLQRLAVEEAVAAVRLRRMLVARVLFRFDVGSTHSRSLDDLYASIRPATIDQRNRFGDVEARVLAEVLEAGVRDGEFDCPDPLATARSMLLATDALMPYSLMTSQLAEREVIAERAGRIADLLLYGVVARDLDPPTR